MNCPFANSAAAMKGVPKNIELRQLVHFHRGDPAYGAGVAAKLGLSVPKDAVAE